MHSPNDTLATPDETSADVLGQEFLGQWNRLVSTTNWEKGRIIHEWRETLVAAGAPAVDYSDDAWSRRVGNVTGQHVGRLRRVYERFGGVHSDYSGLYWSHFQAAIDWNDAEMWLEGAVQNRWSVAEVRRERWQAFGGHEAEQPLDSEIVTAETDEDSGTNDSIDGGSGTGDSSSADRDARGHASNGEYAGGEYQGGPRPEGPDFGDNATGNATAGHGATSNDGGFGDNDDATTGAAFEPVRPFVDLPDLPGDLFDAFEGFKLAILRHKTAAWRDVSCDDVLASLNALKTLALAPA